MDNNNMWAMDFETTIFTMFSFFLRKHFSEKYTDMNITQDEEQDGNPIFPTILLRQMPMSETGKDIEGTSINAIRTTMQVNITYKGKKQNLKELTSYSVLFFKKYGFEISNVFYSVSNDIRASTFRAKRIVGASDILN